MTELGERNLCAAVLKRALHDLGGPGETPIFLPRINIGSFTSPPLNKDRSFTQKVHQPGTVKIHIVQHPNAKGEIDVAP